MSSSLYIDTINLFNELEIFIQEIEKKSIDADSFIINNIEILTNSSIVLACTYLESYIRDSFHQSIDTINFRLDEQKFPDNIFRWSVLKGEDKKLKLDQDYTKCFKIDDSDDYYEKFTDKISANLSTTLKVFLILGIDLKSIAKFQQHKEEIANFIDIRNLIVHRNQQHSITLGDLRNKIVVIKDYLNMLDLELNNKQYLN